MEGARDLALLALEEASPEHQSAHILAATALAQLGDLDGANRTYEDGLTWTQDAGSGGLWQSAIHACRAINLAQVGRFEEARVDGEEAVAIARRLRNPTGLSLALFGLGWSLLGPDPTQARAALEESIALAEAGAIQGGLDAMLGLIAPLRLADGDVAGALDGLSTTVTRMRESGERLSVVNSLDSSLIVLSELGEREVPATITGIRAAETFAPAGAGIAGVARARHDEIVAEVRATLGDEAFDAAAARGAAMSDEDALTFLLTELECVRAGLAPP